MSVSWMGGLGGCCCEGCEVLFADEFNRADDTNLGADWDENVAGWAIAGNFLRTTTATAEALTIKDDFPAEFISNFTFSIGTRSDDSQCLFLFKFGYVDSSNYWLIRFNCSRTTSIFSTLFFVSLSVRRVVAGVETIIGSARLCVGNASGSTTSMQIWVCANTELIHWYALGEVQGITGSYEVKYSYPLPAAIPAGRQGFEVLTLTGTGASLDIDQFNVQTHIDGPEEPTTMPPPDGKCECPKYCRGCQDSIFPDNWQIVIADLVADGANNYALCNGTYVLTGKLCDTTLTIATCANGINQIQFNFEGEAPNFTLRVRLNNTSLGTTILTFTKTLTAISDCMSFNEVATCTATVSQPTATATITDA